MLRITLATFSAFTLFVIAHWLHFHFFDPYDRVPSILMTMLIFMGVYFVLIKYLPSEDRITRAMKLGGTKFYSWLPVLLGAFLYFMLFIGYLEFYFTADRSITFRMLRITHEREGASITAEEMLAAYDTNAIITGRLDDLVYGGYLQKNGDRYSLTPKGIFILSIYRVTIDFLHMRKY